MIEYLNDLNVQIQPGHIFSCVCLNKTEQTEMFIFRAQQNAIIKRGFKAARRETANGPTKVFESNSHPETKPMVWKNDQLNSLIEH